MAADTVIYLRAPNVARVASPDAILPPPLKWLRGTWKLTHSTLPKWRESRNVTVTYTLLPKKPETIPAKDLLTLQWGTRIKDLVSWQPLSRSSASFRTATGLSTPSGVAGEANGELKPDFYGDTFNCGERAGLAYSRRGTGWSRFVSSRWELLGYGSDYSSRRGQDYIYSAEDNSYIVIYVAKTLIAPAGINILCRHRRLPEKTMESIRFALANLADDMTGLAQELVEIVLEDEDVKIRDLNQ